MHPQEKAAIKIRGILESLGAPDRSAIRCVAELCSVATCVDRLECVADESGTVHAFVNGTEVYEWSIPGVRDNFRNLLAVMHSFALQYADRSVAPELSPYRLNCILNAREFGDAEFVKLETVNTASEQRFALIKL